MGGAFTDITDLADPAVMSEIAKSRRGRRSPDPVVRYWLASLRLRPLPRRAAGARSINADVLVAAFDDAKAVRLATLHRHRGDRRDEDQQARRAFLAPLTAKRPKMSAQSLAVWLKRSQTFLLVKVASVRTLRGDVAALRKLGSDSRVPNR